MTDIENSSLQQVKLSQILSDHAEVERSIKLASIPKEAIMNWDYWLSRPEWSSFELAALSMNVDPEWLDVYGYNARPNPDMDAQELQLHVSNWVNLRELDTQLLFQEWRYGKCGDHETPLFFVSIKLKSAYMQKGVSVEQQIAERLAVLAGVTINANGLLGCQHEIMALLIWPTLMEEFLGNVTPEKGIQTLQYHEWHAPAGMLGQTEAFLGNISKKEVNVEIERVELKDVWLNPMEMKGRNGVQAYLGISSKSFYNYRKGDVPIIPEPDWGGATPTGKQWEGVNNFV